jgi:hypothetical protein
VLPNPRAVPNDRALGNFGRLMGDIPAHAPKASLSVEATRSTCSRAISG